MVGQLGQVISEDNEVKRKKNRVKFFSLGAGHLWDIYIYIYIYMPEGELEIRT